MQIQDIAIRTADIRLGQFIKLANLVDSGGVAKELIAAGAVTVNGTVDHRRGAALHPGDVVAVVDLESGAPLATARVVAAAAQLDPDDDLGEYFDETTAHDGFDPEQWRNI